MADQKLEPEDVAAIAASDIEVPDLAENPIVPSVETRAGVAPVLELSHVSRWYGDVIAVNDVSVKVQPGIVGVLGPNGAGKSSLMRMIVGLSRPSAGSVRVLGQDPWSNPGYLRRIGYVPEAKAPWRELPGREVAIRAARLSGLEPGMAERAADDAIARVGLSDAASKPVESYSHGMHQRLKFALAIAHDPDLLILDEPLLGTDPVARRDLLKLMREMGDQGKSLLVSTHVLPDVEALTRRILVMNHGRLMAYGDAGEIRDLLERYPRTVRIQTPAPRAIGAAIWGWESVAAMDIEPDALVIRTSEPAAFYTALQELLGRPDGDPLPFTSITSPDDHVETVFRYLVG